MDSIKFGKLDIPLPNVARTLCEDAVILADELRGDVSDKGFMKFAKEFNTGFVQMCQEIVVKGEPSFGFDPFQLATFPEELVNDESRLQEIFSMYEKSKPFLKLLMKATQNKHDLQSAAMLLLYVEIIQTTEAKSLKEGNVTYATLMHSLSPHISNLHKILVVLSAMPSQAELYSTNYKRKQGARLGGAAKAARNQELKELVITEAATFHQNIDATKAAQVIAEKLTKQGNWLLDENEKPILKDPTVRFTAWIRADRKKKLH